LSDTELLIVVAVGVVAAFIKSIAGMGYPVVLVPVAAIFVPTADAIIFVSISNLALNLALAWSARTHRRNSPLLTVFIVASMVGAVIGAAVLPSLPDTTIRLLLVGIVALFLVNRYRSPEWKISPNHEPLLTPLVGGIAGVFQGAGGISGPVVAPWFLSLKLDRNAYVFATTTVYALSGIAQIAVFGFQGTYTPQLFGIALLLVPFTLAIQPVGIRLRQRLPMEIFERVVLGVLVFAMLSLVARLVI